MADRPAVLGLHLFVELLALLAIGYWGWTAHGGAERWAWAVAVPLLLATVWAIFRAPEDGPDPIVTVAGSVRLLIEIGLMAFAIGALLASGETAWGTVLLALVVVDYALQYERVRRLLDR